MPFEPESRFNELSLTIDLCVPQPWPLRTWTRVIVILIIVITTGRLAPELAIPLGLGSMLGIWAARDDQSRPALAPRAAD